MQSEALKVMNIKCEGCVRAIKSGLLALPGIESVDVAVETGMVSVQGMNIPHDEMLGKLEEMGYPAEIS